METGPIGWNLTFNTGKDCPHRQQASVFKRQSSITGRLPYLWDEIKKPCEVPERFNRGTIHP